MFKKGKISRMSRTLLINFELNRNKERKADGVDNRNQEDYLPCSDHSLKNTALEKIRIEWID